MDRELIAILFLAILLSGLVSLYCSNLNMILDRSKLVSFYRRQFVEGMGLVKAAVTAYPDNITIYVANDNVLASKALAVLGEYQLAARIQATLDKNFSRGFNGKIEILVGEDIPDTFYASYNELVKEVNGYRIVYERLNYSKPIVDWYNYADLLVYRALDELLSGSRLEAEHLFVNLTKLWDGYGFRDKSVNETGIYAIYKLALFIYLYRALRAAGSTIIYNYRNIYKQCLEIIKRAQDPVYGGIHTDYEVRNGEILVRGDVNVETTSIVVLALYSNYPEIIGDRARSNVVLHDSCYGGDLW